MDFLLTLILFFGLFYLLLRYLGPRLFAWCVRYLLQRQAQRQQNFSQRDNPQYPPRNQKHNTQDKLDLKDIAKMKFEKDQGEYVDYEER